MRVLKFIVDGTTIKPDPTCDFNGLFPGRDNEIIAEFAFSSEWKSRLKVAAFWSILDKEYPPQIVNDDGTCIIPIEALSKVAFKMQIIGRGRDVKVETDCLTIYQRGSKQ